MIRRLAAEALGTALLLIAAVGSPIMASALADGNAAVELLASSLATGFMLFVLITTLGPVSGAHLNPAVTVVFAVLRQISPTEALAYILVQIVAAIAGVWVAHAMFDLAILQVSATPRSGGPLWFAEIVATFGLVFAILGGLRNAPTQVPALVGAYIAGAYWFTASTSFANPAVTIARCFTDTASGIAPVHMPGFVGAEMFGALIAALCLPRLFSR